MEVHSIILNYPDLLLKLLHLTFTMYSVQTQNQCCTRCNFCIHHVVSLFTTLYSGMEFHSEPGNSKREELQMEVVILNVVFIREASL